VSSPTLIQIGPNDWNPGDVIAGMGTVLTKQIKARKGEGFDYTFDSRTADQPTSITIPQGEFEALICYKGNAQFFYPIDFNTQFGDWWVTLSQGYGWSTYSEEFSGYIENYHGEGFHWNSGGSRITDGLIIKNSYFQGGAPTFNVSDQGEIDPEVPKYIAWLESL
jgi:hypothetical protein